MRWSSTLLVALFAAGALDEREPIATRFLDDGGSSLSPSSSSSVVETDARVMQALEENGLSLWQVFGASGRNNDALAETAGWASLLTTLEADLAELDARPGIADANPRKWFQTGWLRDKHARFELIGAVNRLDRWFLNDTWCGEARLVYRLVLEPERRPPTSLPMTVSVAFPQPKDATTQLAPNGRAPTSCRAAAQAWRDLPRGLAKRVGALAALYAKLPAFNKVEINVQTLHMPSQGAVFADGTGYDDHAEYLLRSFARTVDRNGSVILVPAKLVNTPRFTLDETEKRDLAAWIRENFDAIDSGRWVVPDRFLAKSALSVTPRGFARAPNRVFKTLFRDDSVELFANLPYSKGRLVKSPAGLLRRLDQGTCEGCHATRSVAGFHLLGESRLPEVHIDAVAVARSPHFDLEIEWRAALTAAVAEGQRVLGMDADTTAKSFHEPRPFADRRRAGPGRSGAHCGKKDDPTFAGWTCVHGLVCHFSTFGSLDDEIGACAEAGSLGVEIGEPCQQVTLGHEPEKPATGPFVEPHAMAPCVFGTKEARCDPNLFGFPGGMCITECDASAVGTPVRLSAGGGRGDELYCGLFPSAGYEHECFTTAVEPIEKCLARHLQPRVLKTCGEHRGCRDDYACARTIGLPRNTGLCVPTYFVYGLRVDGPLLDR